MLLYQIQFIRHINNKTGGLFSENPVSEKLVWVWKVLTVTRKV